MANDPADHGVVVAREAERSESYAEGGAAVGDGVVDCGGVVCVEELLEDLGGLALPLRVESEAREVRKQRLAGEGRAALLVAFRLSVEPCVALQGRQPHCRDLGRHLNRVDLAKRDACTTPLSHGLMHST